METRRKRLAQARKAAGLSQEKLAEHLRLHPGTIHRWESWGREPRGYVLPKLAHLLGVTREELDEMLAEGRDPSRTPGPMRRRPGSRAAQREAESVATPAEGGDAGDPAP
ncbi:helix-turn-helix transcriptional regulator [Actinokineospora auranticolor]|uniref:Helix-turn-helix protein n=1 Tax=Actinokineospora auranticolor TaxID=155976 RepID=A0A2S6GCQ3_9PSEU|nr:helix-turn-helix transcriptional regulator [Actinokineospora auranticolor]PPK62582.1 helix-turn-helix protein [Actinokineospora auranticolor]